MSPELNPAVFQKNWPSTSGFGGAERATMRFTETISQSEPIAILTCGEYYRGKEKPVDYRLPDHIFSENRLTIHEIPSVSQIVDLVLKNRSEIGVFQIGWGFEHYPDVFSRILDTKLPLVLRICETGQYKQLVQELPEDKKKGFLEKIVSRIDALVAISTPLVDEAVEVGFDPEKIHLIYSSVDTNIFSPAESETKKKLLLEAIIGNINCDKGDVLVNEGVDIGYFSQTHEDFNPNNDLIREARSANDKLSIEAARSILGHFLFSGDEQLKKVEVLSQGERSRLALAKLFVGNHNMLILDEPTNHLDISVGERLIEALIDYNGTLIIISNDEEFLETIGIDHQLRLPDCKILTL